MLADREEISRGLAQGLRIKEIASRIGRKRTCVRIVTRRLEERLAPLFGEKWTEK